MAAENLVLINFLMVFFRTCFCKSNVDPSSKFNNSISLEWMPENHPSRTVDFRRINTIYTSILDLLCSTLISTYTIFFVFLFSLKKKNRENYIFILYPFQLSYDLRISLTQRGFWKYTIEAMAGHHHKQMKRIQFSFCLLQSWFNRFQNGGIVTVLHNAIGYFGGHMKPTGKEKYLTGINTVQPAQ